MDELTAALRSTFEDFQLSKNEKVALRDLLQDYKNDADALSFVRNSAFRMVGEHQQQRSVFDALAYKWLEYIVKTLDYVRNQHIPAMESRAYFSPGDECKNNIISAIKNAKTSIDVCVFTISDDDIARALQHAHERNVAVRIITDDDKANDLGSDVDELQSKGLSVLKDSSPKHMHHKFAVIDERFLINGSFNWTRSASDFNNENICVLADAKLVAKFCRKFEQLWTEFS